MKVGRALSERACCGEAPPVVVMMMAGRD